jgi:hypothetical protein
LALSYFDTSLDLEILNRLKSRLKNNYSYIEIFFVVDEILKYLELKMFWLQCSITCYYFRPVAFYKRSEGTLMKFCFILIILTGASFVPEPNCVFPCANLLYFFLIWLHRTTKLVALIFA